MERRNRAHAESSAVVFITLAALVVLNILAIKVFRFRKDLTRRELYSLSQGTLNTLLGPRDNQTGQRHGGLTDTLSITVYWTPDQPAPANNDERLLREQLDEYVEAGNGKVEVRYVRTDNDERRRLADNANCPKRPLQAVNFRDQQATFQEVYRCMTFSYLRSTERIEFVNPGIEGMEYQITSIIKKMINPERSIGFLTGHDEATPDTAMPYLSRILQDNHLGYTTRTVDLHGGEDSIPTDIKGLVIVNPTRRIEERELRRINEYLMRGGSVAVFASGVNVTGTDTRPSAARAEHNLDTLLRGYGVTLKNNVILDPRATDAIEEIEQGRVRIRMFAFPAITHDGSNKSTERTFQGLNQAHSSVFRLPGIVMPFVSQLEVDSGRYCVAESDTDAAERRRCEGQNKPMLVTVARTSDASITQQDNFELDALDLIMRRQTVFGRGGAHGPYTVGLAIAGPLRSAFPDGGSAGGDAGAQGGSNVPAQATSERPARLLVMGSGKMFSIEQLRAIAIGGIPTNVEMLLNTFDWLSQDYDLLAVRAKDVSEPELGEVSDNKKRLFQWGSILGLPLLVGLAGLLLSNLRAKSRRELKV